MSKEKEPQQGLPPKKHKELNRLTGKIGPGSAEALDAEINNLRGEYSGDSEAQRQLDGYDPKSPYYQKALRERDEALKRIRPEKK